MSTPRKLAQGVLEGSAHQLAFDIAQSLERTLVKRAVGLAASDAEATGAVVVTAEHVRRGLVGDILGEACANIGVFLDGKTKTEGWKATVRA